MKRIFALVFALLFASICLADTTVSNGLTVVVPAQGSHNWGTTFLNSFATPISGHDHTGGGKGLQISTNAIATNAITGAKIRYSNNEYSKARNAANSADLNIVKIDGSNKIIFDNGNVDATTRTSLGAAKSGSNDNITSMTALQAITYPAGGFTAFAGTSDNSDNLAVQYGGGGGGETRGAWAFFGGNENASPGLLQLVSGDVSGGKMTFSAPQGTIDFNVGGALKLQLTSTPILKYGGELNISANTADLFDTASLKLNGGGTGTAGRGAHVDVYGYDHGSFPGIAAVTGDGGSVINYTTEPDPIEFYTNATKRWEVGSAGHFTPEVDDTYEIGTSSKALKNIHLKQRTWSPTVSHSGSALFARFRRVGKLIFMTATFAWSGADSSITVTLPSASASLGGSQGGACTYTSGAGDVEPTAYTIAAGSSDMVFERFSGNFTVGTNGILCNAFYEEG